MKKKWILALLLGALTNIAIGAQTTLRFSIPDAPDNPAEEYAKERLFEKFEESAYVGEGRQMEIKVKKRRFKPLYKSWSRDFSAGSPVHEFFAREIAGGMAEIERQVKDAATRSGEVNRVDYVDIDATPLEITLAVRGNKIQFYFRDLKFVVKARMGLHGEAKLICGSNIWAKVKGNIVVTGEYDMYSGVAQANSIDINESIDADCNRPLGKVFDFAVDQFAEKAMKDAVGEFVKPVLQSTVQLVSFNQVFLEPAREAESHLGFNFVDNAWSAIQRYSDGLTLTFRIGVNQFGNGMHLIDFVAYQAPVEYTQDFFWVREKVIVDMGRYGKKTEWRDVKKYLWRFDCPFWASDLKTYNMLGVQTGTQIVEEVVGSPRSGYTRIEHVVPVYGRYRFVPIEYGMLNYVESNGLQFGSFSTCKSYNGLYSPLDAKFDVLNGW